MKNQKQKKIPSGNIKNMKAPAEWLYLAPEGTTLRQIYELFRTDTPWRAEYWEMAEALEIEIPNSSSVDMEGMEYSPLDEAGDTCPKEGGIQTAFAVTIRPEDFEKAKAVMQYIIGKAGGYFCGDTDDFEPQVRG